MPLKNINHKDMIKTSKEIYLRMATTEISTKIEIECDGSMVISIIGVAPYLGQRFSFTPSETKSLAKALNKYL